MTDRPKGIEIVGASSCLDLAKEVTDELRRISDEEGLERIISYSTPGIEFDNGEIGCNYSSSVRGKDVYVIGSHCGYSREVVRDEQRVKVERSPQDAIAEHRILISAARSSSAKRVTAIAPSMGLGRQDRRTGRQAITARMVVEDLERSGAQHIVAVDMHSPQAEGFAEHPWLPFDHITAAPLWRGHLKERYGADSGLVVVSPDDGRSNGVMRLRNSLGVGVGVAILNKKRNDGDNGAAVTELLGDDVKGRPCALYDDMIDGAGTITAAAEALYDAGASEIIAMATHGVFSYRAAKRLANSPITEVCVTNTIPLPREIRELVRPRIEVVSIAPFLASTILAINMDRSIQQIHDGVPQRI